MSQSSVLQPVVRPSLEVSGRSRERLFYSGMAIALTLTVFAGFARTYYLKYFFDTPALPPLVQVHGVLFSLWMVLLLVQTSLVAAGKTGIHRRLGMAGGVLVVLMVVLGTWTAIVAAAQGRTPPGPPPLVFLAIPLGEMVTFPVLVGAALYYRRRIDAHKRLMLLATIGITSAAVARLPFAILQAGPPAFFGLTDLFLVPLAVYDVLTRGRLHPATLWGSLFLIASQVLRVMLSGTEAWLHFATWLTQMG